MIKYMTLSEFNELVTLINNEKNDFVAKVNNRFYSELYNFLDINELWAEAETFFGFEPTELSSVSEDFIEVKSKLIKKVSPIGSEVFSVYGLGNNNPVINAFVLQSKKSKEIELEDGNTGEIYYFPFEFSDFRKLINNIKIKEK